MTPMLIPCSRSAHDQNVLARRPQWHHHGCHSKGEWQASLEGPLINRIIIVATLCCVLCRLVPEVPADTFR